MSRTKGIALPGKSMEEATRNAQKDFLTKDHTGIKEHGMSVWVVGKVKVKLDELKFRSRNTIGCRAFTNAALEFVLEKYGDELVKMFKNK